MIKLKVCRLCLNPNNLIDVFYSKTSCAGVNHLRTCILLCTGINILFEDSIPKYVCKSCCDLSLRLYQFRKQALATEKALNKFEQIQISVSYNFPVDVIQITDLNRLLIKNSNIEVRLTTSFSEKQDTSIKLPNNDYAVHPSVTNIVKAHKNIILPNEVLKDDLNPVVTLDTFWIYEYSDVESDASENQLDSESSLLHLKTNTTSELCNIKTRRSCVNNYNKIDNICDEDENYLTCKKKRKTSLRTTTQQPRKRSKSISVLNKLKDDDKSATAFQTSKVNVFTYNMFFHSYEFNYIKNIYDGYSKNAKNHATKCVNTDFSANIIVKKTDKCFVLENLLWQLSIFHIPIEYSYDEIPQVHVFKSRKKDEDLDSPLNYTWIGCNVIDLHKNSLK
ncbi:uncharacterized protein [Onthophagus taurus]|uniref:uncharacterized protein n=1 Tax=Onthophagus taurus TaxID=166361 RepID=UPI000C20FB24|nr:uncharacterized protein LOC111425119 [Onthophagus taurus]